MIKIYGTMVFAFLSLSVIAQKKPATKTTPKINAPAKAAADLTIGLTEATLFTNNYTKKITENSAIDFGTIDNMQLVVPITEKMKKYDKFRIVLINSRIKKSDEKESNDIISSIFSIDPSGKDFSINYADSKDIRYNLINKGTPENEFKFNMYNPSESEKNFFTLIGLENRRLCFGVQGLIRTGSRYDDQSGKIVDEYKFDLLNTTSKIENTNKLKDNEQQFFAKNKNSYILSLPEGINIVDSYDKYYYNKYSSEYKLSNGLKIFMEEENTDFKTAKELLDSQIKAYEKQAGSNEKLVIEKQEENGAIVSYKEKKLIGKKKTIGTGMVYFFKVDEGLFLSIFISTKSGTTIEDCTKIFEMCKQVTFRKRY